MIDSVLLYDSRSSSGNAYRRGHVKANWPCPLCGRAQNIAIGVRVPPALGAWGVSGVRLAWPAWRAVCLAGTKGINGFLLGPAGC